MSQLNRGENEELRGRRVKDTPGRRNHMGKSTKVREKAAPLGLVACREWA